MFSFLSGTMGRAGPPTGSRTQPAGRAAAFRSGRRPKDQAAAATPSHHHIPHPTPHPTPLHKARSASAGALSGREGVAGLVPPAGLAPPLPRLPLLAAPLPEAPLLQPPLLRLAVPGRRRPTPLAPLPLQNGGKKEGGKEEGGKEGGRARSA
jgi:hypothetical protein